MLTPFSEMFAQAEQGGYAVIAPDFPSLMVARFLIETAEELEAPLLLSYSPALKAGRDLRSFRRYIELVREQAQASSASIGLHLDHANRLEDIQEAIDLGFTSVMIDASQAPWKENVERTQEVVRRAHSVNVKVESELGHVAAAKQYFGTSKKEDQVGVFTDPEKAAEFVSLTGVDALAVAIGTVHGEYEGEPHLDFELLNKLHKVVPVPLVLHGASGTGTENIQRAVKLGIRKINIFSDLVRALREENKTVLANLSDGPNDLTFAQQRATQKVLSEYLLISGSCGTCPQKASNISERACMFLDNSYTCAEAIFLAAAEKEGYTSDSVQKVCSMFSGGGCKSGEICGALVGALAVIGLRTSSTNPDQQPQRRVARKMGNDFTSWFEQRFGSNNCRELTGLDLSDAGQIEKHKRNPKVEDSCYEIIQETARKLEEKNSEGL